MEKREPASSPEADQDAPIGMLSLSTVLIGEVASYLDFEDHVDFGRCNRDTFIGCNNPCTLRELDLIGTDYSSVNLCRFPLLRTLSVDIDQFIIHN